MPKKLPEQVREKVVQLRKAGRTYAEIEAMVTNPETGQPIARPTLISVLKEAGLTRGVSSAAKQATGAVSSPPPTTAAAPSGAPPAARPSAQPARGNGVDEFMPKDKPKPKAQPIDFQCEHCGTEFTADSEDDLPDVCPECGG